MTTADPSERLPNTFAPLGLAIASAFSLAWMMSEGGEGVIWGIVLLAILAGVALSTRYTIRTCRRLASHEFHLSHTWRWIPMLLALAINGMTCFLVTGTLLVALGVLLTGKGVVG